MDRIKKENNKSGFFQSAIWRDYGAAVVMACIGLAFFVALGINQSRWKEDERAAANAVLVAQGETAVSKSVYEEGLKAPVTSYVFVDDAVDVAGLDSKSEMESDIVADGESVSEEMIDGNVAIHATEDEMPDASVASQNVDSGWLGDRAISEKELDDGVAESVFSAATTWEDKETYEESRREMLRRYPGLNNESNRFFLRGFFPSSEDVEIRDESGAVVSNPLDDGRNTTFVSLDSWLVGVSSDGTRHYVAKVVTRSHGIVGGYAGGDLVATYDMTPDRQMMNLHASVLF